MFWSCLGRSLRVFEIRARKRVPWKFGICASFSIRANRRVKKERNKQTKKERKKERKKEIYFYCVVIIGFNFITPFSAFCLSHKFSLFRRGRKNLCKKSSKKSGEFGRGIQRCRGPFCGNDSRSRRRNQRLKESGDDDVVVVYASRRDSDDYSDDDENGPPFY